MPLFDQDSGLLVVAGMVRSTLMDSLGYSLLGVESRTGEAKAYFFLSQGDTVVDCFEVSSTAPFLSQGEACASVISLYHRSNFPLYFQ